MRFETIVVGFDGSPNARLGLEAAIDLVADGGVVHAVTAYEQPSAAETARLEAALPAEYHGMLDAAVAPRG